jgi:outer membrane lipoprotein-sorting protein
MRRPRPQILLRPKNPLLLCPAVAMALLLAAGSACAETAPIPLAAGPAPGDPDLAELLNSTDDLQRGESSMARIEMHIKTARFERTVAMTAWSEGTDKSLMIIESPAREKGIATLKVGDNIWNYLPKVDRTMKVPASMMSGAWMGSHFSNDDLVKENRLSEEFTYALTSRPPDNPEKAWVIELKPKPDAPVVWGRVVVRVRDADRLPIDMRYYDEDDKLVRTLSYDDVRVMGGRRVPARMRVVPADKPGEFTEITYQELQFDVPIPASTFTLQSLRK